MVGKAYARTFKKQGRVKDRHTQPAGRTGIAEARVGTTQLETVPEPKYWHLKTVLSEALDSEFAVGEILPNERELAARFGVARATLRQALEQLELEGRLQRRRGVGTTVAPPRVGVDVGSESGPRSWPGAPGDAWHTEDHEQALHPLGGAHLPLEPAPELRVLAEVAPDHLDGDGTPARRVRQIDLAHAARAEPRRQPVPGHELRILVPQLSEDRAVPARHCASPAPVSGRQIPGDSTALPHGVPSGPDSRSRARR